MSPSNLGSMLWFGCLFAALWLTPLKLLALSHSYKSTRWGRKWRNFETIDSFGSTPSFVGFYSALSFLWKPFTTNFSLAQLCTCHSITLQNVVTSDCVWPGPGLCWAPSSNWLGRVTRLRPGVRSLSGVRCSHQASITGSLGHTDTSEESRTAASRIMISSPVEYWKIYKVTRLSE